ncbi:MAG TPA: hypothetical protein VIZ17_06340, partial [Acetobacteraceae bacterium]
LAQCSAEILCADRPRTLMGRLVVRLAETIPLVAAVPVSGASIDIDFSVWLRYGSHPHRLAGSRRLR